MAIHMTSTAKKVISKKEPIKTGAAKKNAPSAKKSMAKNLVAKKAVKIVPVKSVKKAAVSKADAAKKVVPAKKTTPSKGQTTKASPAKKSAQRTPTVVKPSLAKKAPAKKGPVKPFPAKLQSTTTGDSTTITVTPREVNAGPEIVIEERRLVMPPPPRPVKSGKRAHSLKPIKGAPTPLVVHENENPWTAAELKSMRSELAKELIRLKSELSEAEGEMQDLISSAGVGAGDDQADAGTKTFEREHEMSLVYNARDMVLQTERAIDRIDNKTYGRCEECGNAIGKARLQVFPRATLCMSCKQKEERR
jgi:DnaK suppressor protein